MSDDELTIMWPPPAAKEKCWAGIARMGGIGDNLVAASVLRPLKRAGFMTEVISQRPYHVVFENNPHLDRLMARDKDSWPKDHGQWQLWFADRAKDYDLFANLSHTMEHMLAFFPGQTAFYWPAQFRRRLANRSYIEVAHDVLGMPYEFGPLFFPTEAERECAIDTKRRIGGKVVGWCISGTRIDKIYPQAPFVIARLIKDLGVSVVMMGAPGKDYDLAKVAQESVGNQNGTTDGLHFAISPDAEAPSWPIRRILTMAAACDLVIGPDTGPMWGVAFEEVPKIVTLSHASPENITKHWVNTTTLHANPGRVPCWPCHQLHDGPETCHPNKNNNGAACISDISVDAVIQMAAKLLGT